MRGARGFTLTELLVVVAIAAIFATVALPSFGEFVRSMRLASGASDLHSDLLLARSESIRRNARVVVCPRSSATSTSCAATVTAGTWMNGWLVCYDVDADSACDPSTASDPNPVRVRSAPGAPLSLTGPGVAITFFPVGSANAAATFSMTGGGGTTSTRLVTVVPSGNITSSKS